MCWLHVHDIRQMRKCMKEVVCKLTCSVVSMSRGAEVSSSRLQTWCMSEGRPRLVTAYSRGGNRLKSRAPMHPSSLP